MNLEEKALRRKAVEKIPFIKIANGVECLATATATVSVISAMALEGYAFYTDSFDTHNTLKFGLLGVTGLLSVGTAVFAQEFRKVYLRKILREERCMHYLINFDQSS